MSIIAPDAAAWTLPSMTLWKTFFSGIRTSPRDGRPNPSGPFPSIQALTH